MFEKWLDRFDYQLLSIIILLATVSFVTLSDVQSLGLSNDNYLKKQVIYYVISFLVFIGMTFVDLSAVKKLSFYSYFACLILLAGILIAPADISPVINGARGWYIIGSLSIQPAELMKIGFILALSYVAEKHDYQESLKSEFKLIGKMLLLLFPIVIILKEFPDLGSLLVHIFIFFCILMVSRIRLKTIFIYIVSIPLSIFVSLFMIFKFWPNFFFDKVLGILPEYQAERFYGWLKPNEYVESGYQLSQSMTSIGAGQLDGYSSILHVPYAYSDFIFAVIGSQYGFIGASIVIVLFFLLIFRIITISINYNEDFGKYIGAGIVGLITYHVFQNIGMSIGLIPITGIGLPFISYGGSSLIVSMMCMGLMMSLKMHTRKYMFE